MEQEQKKERVNDYALITPFEAKNLLSMSGVNATCEPELTLFSDGKSTTNYLINANNTKFVLRIYQTNGEICDKEYTLSQKFHGKIRTPCAIYADSSCRRYPRPFMVSEFAEGKSLASFISENTYTENAIAQSANALSIIHENKYPSDGMLTGDLQLKQFLPIRMWYESLLNGVAGGRLGNKKSEMILSLINSSYGQESLDILCSGYVLNHGDFRPENILVHNGNLSAILDWEFALSAPKYFDLSQFIRFFDKNSKISRLFITHYENYSGEKLHKDWFCLMRFIDLTNFLSLLAMPRDNPQMFSVATAQIEKTLNLFEKYINFS